MFVFYYFDETVIVLSFFCALNSWWRNISSECHEWKHHGSWHSSTSIALSARETKTETLLPERRKFNLKSPSCLLPQLVCQVLFESFAESYSPTDAARGSGCLTSWAASGRNVQPLVLGCLILRPCNAIQRLVLACQMLVGALLLFEQGLAVVFLKRRSIACFRHLHNGAWHSIITDRALNVHRNNWFTQMLYCATRLCWSRRRLQPLPKMKPCHYTNSPTIRPSTLNHDRKLWHLARGAHETTCLTVFFRCPSAVTLTCMELFNVCANKINSTGYSLISCCSCKFFATALQFKFSHAFIQACLRLGPYSPPGADVRPAPTQISSAGSVTTLMTFAIT